MRVKNIFLVLLSLGLISCSDELPDYNTLEDLRIIALKVDLPEVNPGTEVSLNALVSDIGGDGRSLSYSLISCTDPGVAYGAEPSCDNASDKVEVAEGTVSNLVEENAYTLEQDSVAFTIPSEILDLYSEVESYNGVAYLVVYTLTAENGDSVKGFKRIIVTSESKTIKNSNPTIVEVVDENGNELSVLPQEETDYKINVSSESMETYTEYVSTNSLTSLDEVITTTWFLSDGSMKYYRTINESYNSLTPATEAPTDRPSVIVVVSRDGRGGVDYQKIQFD